METAVKLSQLEILIGLKNKTIEIDSYENKSGEIEIAFCSNNEQLEENFISVDEDKVIQQLEENGYPNVHTHGDSFISTEISCEWEDMHGNYEEERSEEYIDQSIIIESLYEILLQDKPTLNFEVTMLPTTTAINLSDWGLTVGEWLNYSEEERRKLIIEKTIDEAGQEWFDIKNK